MSMRERNTFLLFIVSPTLNIILSLNKHFLIRNNVNFYFLNIYSFILKISTNFRYFSFRSWQNMLYFFPQSGCLLSFIIIIIVHWWRVTKFQNIGSLTMEGNSLTSNTANLFPRWNYINHFCFFCLFLWLFK